MQERRSCVGGILMALLIMTGCEGPAGPKGEPGQDGADGKDGQSGQDGSAGANGTNGTNGDDGKDGNDGADGQSPQLRLLSDNLTNWLEDNRERLNEMLLELGATSKGYNPAHRPVAIFDWDNTVLKNDIGDATFFWMVANNKVLRPEESDWSATSEFLSVDALDALSLACDALALPGNPLPTGTGTAESNACADELLSIYIDGKTAAGLSAWTTTITLTTNTPYAWVVQLQAGYTPQEVRDMAVNAFDQNAWAEIGATQTIGTKSVTGYVRVYEEIRDLAEALDANGFDVWVLSASGQFVVEAISDEIGVPAHRVIGVRSVIEGGRLTADFYGCGTVADGENTLISFDEGKRCWINKIIYSEPVDTQMQVNADPGKRPVFVAGDSDTDIAMLKDATFLKLAINRNKTQIMCNAYADVNGKWLVQPMFISPKSQKTSGYACSSAKDAAGNLIVDEEGNPIPDQVDSIYALPE